MAFAWNVSRDLGAVGEPDAGHFAESGVLLLGGHDLDLKANPAFLGTADKGRMFRPAVLLDTRLAHQLIDCWHSLLQNTSDSPILPSCQNGRRPSLANLGKR